MKLNKKFIVLGLAFLCIGTSATIAITKNYNPENKQEIEIDDSTLIKSSGIDMKLLKTEDNSNGEKSQTFSYTISPANATNQDVIVSLTYIDGTNCDEVMGYSIDQDNKQITLNCKKAFAKQIKCVITSAANSKATSTVMLDYVKKLTSVSLCSDNPSEINIGTYDSDIDDYDNTCGNHFYTYGYLYDEFEYSVYTKDYTYDLKVVDMHAKLVLDNENADSYINIKRDNKELYDLLKEDSTIVTSLENFVNQGFQENKTFTDDDLYNLSANEKWHNYLIKRAVRPYATKTNMIEFSISDDGQIDLEDKNSGSRYKVSIGKVFPVRLSLWGKYDKYVVNVDSLTSEIFNLDF